MYSSSEDSDSDSGTFKRGKRKVESPPKPVIQRQREEPRRDDKRDRRERFDTKLEPRDEARMEKHCRRSSDRSEKYSKPQSSSQNVKHVRPRSPRSRSRELHDSRNRHSYQSERRPSPRREVKKDYPEKSHDVRRTQVPSRSSKETSRDVRKPSPDAKYFKESKSNHRPSQRDECKSSNAPHTSRSSSQDDAASYGPALPPPKTKKIDPIEYAPTMPHNLKRRSSSPKQSHKSKHDRPKSPRYESRNYGPSLPKDFALPMETATYEDQCDYISSDDDGGMIGPLPASAEMSERDLELEKRKIEIKLQQLDRRMEAVNSSDTKHREEWMLELPEIKKVPDMGLSARQFRKNARPDFSDRSSWTKTPNDGHKKSAPVEKSRSTADDAERTRDLERRRDEDQEKRVKEHKKAHKRNKTLLEIHEKIKKKEKKKEKDEKKVRVPFSRDTDLAANKFDEARKKSVLKKAQLLDTRFSSGSRKYL